MSERFTETLRAASELGWSDAVGHRFVKELFAGAVPDAVPRMSASPLCRIKLIVTRSPVRLRTGLWKRLALALVNADLPNSILRRSWPCWRVGLPS